MTRTEMLNAFFDFDGLYREIKQKTLEDYPTYDEYMEFIKDGEYDIKAGSDLYHFLISVNHDVTYMDLELSEDNDIETDEDSVMTISYTRDLMYSELSGTDEGQEYIFAINLEYENFVGLMIVDK
jgi:hypothetical protein